MSFTKRMSLRITEARADVLFEARSIGFRFLELIKKIQAV